VPLSPFASLANSFGSKNTGAKTSLLVGPGSVSQSVPVTSIDKTKSNTLANSGSPTAAALAANAAGPSNQNTNMRQERSRPGRANNPSIISNHPASHIAVHSSTATPVTSAAAEESFGSMLFGWLPAAIPAAIPGLMTQSK
jgi:hypothetical protein